MLPTLVKKIWIPGLLNNEVSLMTRGNKLAGVCSCDGKILEGLINLTCYFGTHDL